MIFISSYWIPLCWGTCVANPWDWIQLPSRDVMISLFACIMYHATVDLPKRTVATAPFRECMHFRGGLQLYSSMSVPVEAKKVVRLEVAALCLYCHRYVPLCHWEVLCLSSIQAQIPHLVIAVEAERTGDLLFVTFYSLSAVGFSMHASNLVYLSTSNS